jgi:hypothetical protein
VAFPAENKCHIQVRLTSLFPGDAEMIDRACRGDARDDDLAPFVEFLRTKVAPFCEDLFPSISKTKKKPPTTPASR